MATDLDSRLTGALRADSANEEARDLLSRLGLQGQKALDVAKEAISKAMPSARSSEQGSAVEQEQELSVRERVAINNAQRIVNTQAMGGHPNAQDPVVRDDGTYELGYWMKRFHKPGISQAVEADNAASAPPPSP